MNLAPLIIAMNISIFCLGVILIAQCVPYRKKPEVFWLNVFVVSMCVISFCSLNVYAQLSFEAMTFYSRMRFLGIALLAPSWLFFLCHGYGGWLWMKRPIAKIIFLAPACVTILFTLVPSWNDMVLRNFSVLEWKNTSIVRFESGPWFIYHFSFSLILTFMSFFFAGTLFLRKELQGQRTQIMALVTGSVLSVVIDFYCVYTQSVLRWSMLSSATFLLTEAGVFYSIFRYGLLDVSPMAKDKLFREIPDPILVIDSEGRLQEFNRSAKELFGLTSRSLYLDLKDSVPSLRLDERIENPEWKMDVSGQTRTFHVLTEKIGAGSVRLGKIVVLREITQYKEIELQLNQHLEVKARLLALIAHDFSGFLQTQTNLSNFLEKAVHPELKSHAGALSDSVFASQDFMVNILNWANTQETKFQPVIRPVELNHLVQTVLTNLSAAVEHRGIRIRLESRIEKCIVQADSTMIECVVRNILSNAVRASKSHSDIRIGLDRVAGSVCVEIEDEGEGMSSEQLENLMRTAVEGPFESRTKSGGFGIGLSIARRFLKLHGSDIQIRSEPGKGTSVAFALAL